MVEMTRDAMAGDEEVHTLLIQSVDWVVENIWYNQVRAWVEETLKMGEFNRNAINLLKANRKLISRPSQSKHHFH